MTTSRNNTIMSWMAYTDFLSRLRIAAGILLPLNTRTLLLYPGGRDCIGAAGIDAYPLTMKYTRTYRMPHIVTWQHEDVEICGISCYTGNSSKNLSEKYLKTM